jgi:hypothetical protein
MKKPPELYLLMILVIFQAISGVFGGVTLVYDPTGNIINMPLEILHDSIFKSFLIPGIILLILLGLFPLLIFILMIFEPQKDIIEIINIYPDRKYIWAYNIYLGIMLLIWITVELHILETVDVLHTVYAFVGILILIISLSPRVMRYYELKK